LNTDSYDITGFETGFDWNPTRRTTFSLYYSHLDPGRYTAGRPGSKWDFSLRRNSGKIMTVVSAQSVSDYFSGDNETSPISDFTVWNLRLNYPSDSNMQVFLSVDNLFDRDYDIYSLQLTGPSGACPMPGRAITLGVKADF
jgi:outer membrane receptor protein involved in Fe transport